MIKITKTAAAIAFEARLRNTDALAKRASELALVAAEKLAQDIKNSILKQTAKFAPLSPSTKKRDPRILVDTQAYVNSIKAVPAGQGQAEVQYDNVGNLHEYGTANMPARPHIAPAVAALGERANTQVKVRLEKIFKEMLG